MQPKKFDTKNIYKYIQYMQIWTKKTIKLNDQEGRDFVTKEVRFITPELRAIIDTICFMAVYGHNNLLEVRVPAARSNAFHKYALKAASDNEDKFYAAWKRYCAANPSNASGGADTDESESKKITWLLDGGSDGEVEAGPAAGGSPADEPAASAAEAAAAPSGGSAWVCLQTAHWAN